METRKLGRTGIAVSALCLGTMQFGWTADEETSYAILDAAFAAGINFLDTADIYSNWAPGNPGGVAEEIIGRWMKRRGVPRGEVVIATKVRGRTGPDAQDEGLNRAHILRAAEASLRRLGTDHIDLYLAHWYDERTPIEETLSAFDDLIRQGKVRAVGASNYPAWRLMQALWAADKGNLARYDCLEPHYNLVHRAEFEGELADVCREYGLGVLPYSPLAGGFLSGKYRRGAPLPDSARAAGVTRKYLNEYGWTLLEKMDAIAASRNAGRVSHIALAWLLANPLITSPILGPRNLAQLEDNLGALSVRLDAEEIAILNQIG